MQTFKYGEASTQFDTYFKKYLEIPVSKYTVVYNSFDSPVIIDMNLMPRSSSMS